MWVPRKYKTTLAALFQQFPAVVVTGPRQVGKTATVRRVFPQATYVPLTYSLLPRRRRGRRSVYRGITEPAILDEVPQYALPERLRQV